MSDQAALRRALESALAADFDDLAAHRAYADLLTEMGDPRGELVAVQLALEDAALAAAERAELERREAALLKAYQRKWLGDDQAALFPDFEEAEVQPAQDIFGPRHSLHFRRGWLAALRLLDFSTPLAKALARAPAARLLADLTLWTEPGHDDRGYAALARAPCLDALRRFQLGPEENSHTDGSGIAVALARMPRLEELRLYAHDIELAEVFALPFPNLRVLHVYHVAAEYPLEVLAGNPALTRLAELALWPHGLEYGDDAYIQPGPFRALCFSPHLSRLTRLSVQLSDIGDDGARALVESGLLGRLCSLDLHNGCITDDGAQALASSPDIRDLEYLRITNNQLTPAGVAALRGRVPNLVIEDQFDPRALEHNWHLMEGDME